MATAVRVAMLLPSRMAINIDRHGTLAISIDRHGTLAQGYGRWRGDASRRQRVADGPIMNNASQQPPADRSEPRQFARGSGFIFQFVGFIFLFGGCCVGSLSGLIQGRIDATPRNVVEWLTQSPPGQVIAAFNIIVTGLAGLALMVFGVGLSTERRGSATGAAITAAILTISWCATTIATVMTVDSFRQLGAMTRLLGNILFAALSVWILLMALAARREMRLHPPPPDEPVTPEFLAQFDTQRKLEQELEDESRDA